MKTKKFWCHYIGNDDKPKRRSIELIEIAEIIPAVNDKLTSVWLNRMEETYRYSDRVDVYYEIYHQISENVAVLDNKCHHISADHVNALNETDGQIRERRSAWFRDCWVPLHRNESEEVKDSAWKKTEEKIQNDIKYRDDSLQRLLSISGYTEFLLSEARWVNMADLAAYKEARPDIYPLMAEKRKECEKARHQLELQRKEEARKRMEEEDLKRKEEEAAEAKRLSEEEEKFKNGASISGEDVVTLCRKHGIQIHLRTVHNLQQVICVINGKGECQFYRQRGKRTPVLDGCYKTATELYNYLNR